MPAVVSKSFSTRGTGAPDYEEVIHKGAVAQRIVLDADEILVLMGLLCDDIASPYNHARAALAVAETAYAVDLTTGLQPYVIPAGYSLDIYFYWWSFGRPVKGYQYGDTFLYSTLHESSFVSHYENEIGPVANPLDPTGLTAHTLGYGFENMGDDTNEGYFMSMIKIFPVGTPPLPDSKDVKCKYCDHITKGVDRKATKNTCPKCGMVTLYYPRLLGSEMRKR